MGTKQSLDSAADVADLVANLDVLIIGAGFSGINAAYRLQTDVPGTSYKILESRDSIGGTWDLFRYPGIRSDSDIYSFGFFWSPWYRNETLAHGWDIKKYMQDSAVAQGIDKHIQYRHKAISANWISKESRWEVLVQDGAHEQPVLYRTQFIFLGTGYYNYEKPRQTSIPGIDNFQGKIIHPQFWPEDYDYTGKNVAVIGSGATAITIVPVMAEKANKVTMVQRSPTYLLPIANRSWLRTFLSAVLPRRISHKINRSAWIFVTYLMTVLCANFPGIMRRLILRGNQKLLPPNVPLDPHFSPRYKPWDQRLCVCPDGDFFAAIRSNKAAVVTDTIKTITSDSIQMTSGEELPADVIVTATGIQLLFAGGIQLTIDDEPFDVSKKLVWNAAMIQDLPNVAFSLGYLKSGSWTLGADCAAQLLIRLMQRLKRRNQNVFVPYLEGSTQMETKPLWGLLNSTYLKGYEHCFPQTGTGIWCNRAHPIKDMYAAKWGGIETGLSCH